MKNNFRFFLGKEFLCRFKKISVILLFIVLGVLASNASSWKGIINEQRHSQTWVQNLITTDHKKLYFSDIPRQNKYPHISEQLRPALIKLKKQTGKTFRFIFWGDSVFSRENHTSLSGVIGSSYPPGLTSRNFVANFWDESSMEKASYSRYDAQGIFEENGEWKTMNGKAIWDDNTYRPGETRVSTTPSASLSFQFTKENQILNFIDRTAVNGANQITVSCTEGIIEVKLPGTKSWVEANGVTFGQKQDYDQLERIGNTIYQRRIEFRRKLGSSGSTTIKLVKDTTSDVFHYWGIETRANTHNFIQVINVARGSHTLEQLIKYMDSDVIDRSPDLVVLELPLINMMTVNSSMSYNLNWVQDLIWGDRPGAENDWNLRTRSDNWKNFQVLVVIPHISAKMLDMSKKSYSVLSSGYTALEIHNEIKAILLEKGDVPFIDMHNALCQYTDDYFSKIIGSSVTGNSFSSDGVHMNDLGTEIYAREFNEIFR